MSDSAGILTTVFGPKLQSPQWWASPMGGIVLSCLVILVVGGILCLVGNMTLYGIGVLVFLAVLSILMWTIRTKRLFLRDGFWLSCFWLVSISGVSFCVYQFVYPHWIQNTLIDVPFVRYWGSALVFILCIILLLYVECRFVKREKLLLIVAINNVNDVVEGSVRDIVQYAKDKIIQSYPYVEIELLPFNLYQSQNKYERYMKRPFVQADALMYATIMDDGKASFVITNFALCANYKLLKLNRNQSESLLKSIEASHKTGHSWEVGMDDICKAKIKLGDDLYNMVLMYVSCLYLLKNEFCKSLPVVEEMYNQYRDDLGPIGKVANKLFTKALLVSAYSIETKEQNYKVALERLNQCVQLFPFVKRDLYYQTAMARLAFHLNDLPSSKYYTNQFRYDNPWGYDLNMGFYAICENKVGEFVSRYRKMLKDPIPDKEERDFAQNFLQDRRKECCDIRRAIMLSYAIATLCSYDSVNKAHREILWTKTDLFSEEERKSLTGLQGVWRKRI